jgi:hypothetical protein
VIVIGKGLSGALHSYKLDQMASVMAIRGDPTL